MRPTLVGLFALSLAVGLVGLTADSGHAKKSPEAKVNKRLGKAADRATRKIVRSARKRIRGAAKTASARIKALTKAVKTGRDLPGSSPPAKGGTVVIGQVQADAVFEEFVLSVADYHGEVLTIIDESLAEAVLDPDVLALLQSPDAKGSSASSGVVTGLTKSLAGEWGAAGRTVTRAAGRLEDELFEAGHPIHYVDCAPAVLDPPDGTQPERPLLLVPQVVGTAAKADGDVGVFVARDPDGYGGDLPPSVLVLGENGAVLSNLGVATGSKLGPFVRLSDTTLSGGHRVTARPGLIDDGAFGSPPAPLCVPPEPPPGPGSGSGTSEDPFLLPDQTGRCGELVNVDPVRVGFGFFFPGDPGGDDLFRLPSDTTLALGQTVFFNQAAQSVPLETRVNGVTVFQGGIVAEGDFGTVPDVIVRFAGPGSACVEIFLDGELKQRTTFPVD